MFTDIFTTNKQYNIIYADPPWFYNKRKNPTKSFGKGAAGHYNVMKFDEIATLPIPKIADNNCVLFLWVTFPNLKEGVNLFESWGFKLQRSDLAGSRQIPRTASRFSVLAIIQKATAKFVLWALKEI